MYGILETSNVWNPRNFKYMETLKSLNPEGKKKKKT
jgi:hypothetical protein